MSDLQAARARGYRLMADLIDGDRAAIEQARDREPLSEWLAGIEDDELLAAHYVCFGRNAFPHAGAYLDAEGLIGDGDDLVSALRPLASGSDVAPELALLLSWLPPFALAARSIRARFWPRVIDLVVDLVGEHAAELEVVPPTPRLDRFEIAGDTGLSGVAAALCLPRTAGFLVTCDHLRRLSRQLELPAGFGPRRQLTRQLLESAATYGRGVEALAGLEAIAAQAAEGLEALSRRPGLRRACQPWIEQSGATRATLARMRAELTNAGSARATDG